MGYSITARLNPNTIYPYVCLDEINDKSPTIFHLKALTILQYRECEELYSDSSSIGGSGLKILEYGLIGWDNFTYDSGDIIPFDFYNVSTILYKYQVEIYNKIYSLSEVDEGLIEDIKLVVKWSDWIDKAKNPEQWDCEFCSSKKGMAKNRNCDGTQTFKCNECNIYDNEETCSKCGARKKLTNKFRFSNKVNDFVDRCPIGMLSPVAIRLTNLVNYMDGSKTLPFSAGALEQTNFYYVVRAIVLSEQNNLLKREMDQMKKEAGNKGKGK